MPGPVNCFTYCLLVYNPPFPLPPLPHTQAPTGWASLGLFACNRPQKAASTFPFGLISSRLALARGERSRQGEGEGEGGLKGRWQGHSSEPGTAAGGRASMHCSYQPSPPQTLAGPSFAKHYSAYSTAEAVEFGR